MKILITGSSGFIGKNLVATLKNIKEGKDKSYSIKVDDVLLLHHDSSQSEMLKLCTNADCIIHLAGVSRPQSDNEFAVGNVDFLDCLLQTLKKVGNACPIIFTSSIQAQLTGRFANSEYGKTKLKAEKLLLDYASKTGSKVFIYRLPNVFGKWSRPGYNSVVATFCYNIANDLPIQVHNRQEELNLVYIDDVIREILSALENEKPQPSPDNKGQSQDSSGRFCSIQTCYRVSVGTIADLVTYFGNNLESLELPGLCDRNFEKKLCSTFLSYLPKEKVSFSLKSFHDERGSFTELFKTKQCGQFSVNICKPNQTKGQHWHHSKWEFFVVVSGHGLIEERRIDVTHSKNEEDSTLKFEVDGQNLCVVRMLPGYAHKITNLSETEDLITVVWANDTFNPLNVDTYRENV